MKSKLFKLVILSLVIFGFLANPDTIAANAPVIRGRVLTKDPVTGSEKPLPVEVWVKWSDYESPECVNSVPAQCSLHGARFAKTTNTAKFEPAWSLNLLPGDFYFCPFQGIGACKAVEECGQRVMIDTNLDGTNDAYKVTMYDGYQNCNSLNYRGFACKENSHIFSVIKPAGFAGEFKTVSGADSITLDINANAGGEIDLGTFYYSEPTPTPTPTKPVSCNCNGMDYTGNLTPGETVIFTTSAKVENPSQNMGKVLDVTYSVYENGVEIPPAPGETRTVPATGPVTVNGADVYTVSWNYLIPAPGAVPATFRVHSSIGCTARTSQLMQTQSRILGTSDYRKPFWKQVTDIFGLFLSEVKKGKVLGAASQLLAENVTNQRTLKLSTFNPLADVKKLCEDVIFTVN